MFRYLLLGLSAAFCVQCLPSQKPASTELKDVVLSTNCQVNAGITLNFRSSPASGQDNFMPSSPLLGGAQVRCEKPEAVGFIQCQYEAEVGFLYYRSDWMSCEGVTIDPPSGGGTGGSGTAYLGGTNGFLSGYHFFDGLGTTNSGQQFGGRRGWGAVLVSRGAKIPDYVQHVKDQGFEVIARVDYDNLQYIPHAGAPGHEKQIYFDTIQSLLDKGIKHIILGNEGNVNGPGELCDNGWCTECKNDFESCKPNYYADVYVEVKRRFQHEEVNFYLAAVSPDYTHSGQANKPEHRARWMKGDEWLRQTTIAIKNKLGGKCPDGLAAHSYGTIHGPLVNGEVEFDTRMVNIKGPMYLNFFAQLDAQIYGIRKAGCGNIPIHIAEFNTKGMKEGANESNSERGTRISEIINRLRSNYPTVKSLVWYSWNGGRDPFPAVNDSVVRDALNYQ